MATWQVRQVGQMISHAGIPRVAGKDIICAGDESMAYIC